VARISGPGFPEECPLVGVKPPCRRGNARTKAEGEIAFIRSALHLHPE
jgi:hypothetical protein